MRVFVHFHESADSQLASYLVDGAHGGDVFFASVSEDDHASTDVDNCLARLHAELARVVARERLKLVGGGDMANTRIVARRTETKGAPATDSHEKASSSYRVQTAADAAKIRIDDYLHVFCHSAAGAAVVDESKTTDATTGATFDAEYASLPSLSSTHSVRQRSSAEELLAALDAVDPVCTVARSAEEIVVDVSEIASHASQPWSNESRVAYAANLLSHMKRFGFLRLRFDESTLREIRDLYDVQREFFGLTLEEKLRSGPFVERASSYQIPFGYSAKSECHKEFFVVRPPPSDLNGTAAERFTLPTNPERFADSAMQVYNTLGLLCQQLMALLLQALCVAQPDVEELLAGSLDPPSGMHELGYTSVVELFRYRADAIRPPTAAAVVTQKLNGKRKRDADDADGSVEEEMRIDSTTTLPPPEPTSDRPPPLPCSIHSDASLLTLIPRCIGPPGLQLWNPHASDWQAVEAQCAADEGVVFIGDMLSRVTNDALMPTQHRVAFHTKAGESCDASATTTDVASSPTETGADRYSFPFELFLSPATTVDCAHLLRDAPDLMPIHERNRAVQSAHHALAELSRNRVSVNKTNLG